MLKILAYYLPQYHETKENNKWWGKGFTEWTSVKESKPLYPGHYQPAVPLNQYYYDLTDINAWKWQAELARKYSIYGFCIHHYWFKGKQLLQKPAELLLNHKEININYCFSWANESWTRTWNRGDGNTWSPKNDLANNKSGNGMLMLQEYGTEQDWKIHFNYLLPFFKDDRYIKEANQPMLLIYHPEKIQCLHSMLKIWNALAIENGFDGIYIVSTNNLTLQDNNIAANALFEPLNYFNTGMDFWEKTKVELIYTYFRKKRELPLLLKYSKCWKDILYRKYNSTRPTYYGCVVSFDKTPREGKNSTIYLGANPKSFYKHICKLINKSIQENKDYLFINAWNEWGEGCALEPNSKYKYKYLEAISKAVNK
ncbi:MAG: glycoside hydrolase family 99-like domain-containing protein [Lachnospiraceae bacterium]|nr:glycoside hydrolase family 99-like domain-containing protein [Lachnospiraceae bacterium]